MLKMRKLAPRLVSIRRAASAATSIWYSRPSKASSSGSCICCLLLLTLYFFSPVAPPSGHRQRIAAGLSKLTRRPGHCSLVGCMPKLWAVPAARHESQDPEQQHPSHMDPLPGWSRICTTDCWQCMHTQTAQAQNNKHQTETMPCPIAALPGP